MRVVSLLPSATEICCALGVDPVGVTHECDYPPRVREAPTVVRSRIDTDGSSHAIDDEVQASLSEGGVYDLDADRLRDLAPDVVVTQGLCDVCAVDESVVRGTLADLALDADLVATHPHSLADVFDDIERLGGVLGRADAASDLLADLRERVDAVRARVPSDDDRPTATVLDWLDPVMVSGHWVPELVECAGGRFELGTAGAESGPVEWERVRETDPEVLVVAPCGFGVDRTRETLSDLTARPGWDDLRAVREGRVYVVDGNHYVNRPGPRLVDTLEAFAWTLHPDRFDRPPAGMVERLSPARESV
ncbi:cobalamin-binding protein [Salinigranum rubrum]|uniref:Cobalamin-binding protein n=1 Tax=Salinigranum rubrum TaxID=755307 RepID=A0A2I8VLD0_9EURY|nr:cobalamin-binding protein [Salinigranum rubrum]AUV82732.1 cobalamin-binding protein [Salinigranum rubrum]